jgi:hypothetical protein
VRSRVGRLVCGGGLALVLALVVAEGASGFIYFAAEDGDIARANLDGSGRNDDFIVSTHASGIAVDGRHIYWTDARRDTIGRANLDGSAVDREFITGANWPRGVAVNDRHIYWANFGGHSIGAANLDGSKVDQQHIPVRGLGTGPLSPCGVAVDDTHIYWAQIFDDSIGRATLDRSQIEPRFFWYGPSPAPPEVYPCGIAVNETTVIWAAGRNDAIDSIALDGGSAFRFGTGTDSSPCGVAINETHVYWTQVDEGRTTVGRANIDGDHTSVIRDFIRDTRSCALAVDEGYLPPASGPTDADPPETEITKRPRKRVRTKRAEVPATFRFASDEPGSTFECKLDGGGFEPCDSRFRTRVGDGKHRFKVRAIDSAGNVDPTPARRRWKVVGL